MSENIEQAAPGEEVLLPEGWTEDEDLFAESGDESPATPEDAPEEAPITGDTPAGRKLRFTARIDHEDRDVELDESELPGLYQRAQVTERAQQRLQELSGVKQAPGKRDLAAEAEELLAVFPQMQGHSIPTEVVLESLRGQKSLTAAFAAYTERQHAAELSALQRENSRRAAGDRAAARAPVHGVSGGGPAPKPADPFLSGFNSEY